MAANDTVGVQGISLSVGAPLYLGLLPFVYPFSNLTQMKEYGNRTHFFFSSNEIHFFYSPSPSVLILDGFVEKKSNPDGQPWCAVIGLFSQVMVRSFITEYHTR